MDNGEEEGFDAERMVLSVLQLAAHALGKKYIMYEADANSRDMVILKECGFYSTRGRGRRTNPTW